VDGVREAGLRSRASLNRAGLGSIVRGLCRWILFFAALVPTGVQADDAPPKFSPQVWISPGIYALHFDRSKNLRNDNPGPGVEVALARNHILLAGSYINSNRARTRYGAYEWRPLHWRVAGLEVGAGIALGAFDGYPKYRNGGWFVAPLPVVAIEGSRFGVNLSVIPTIRNRLDGALAVQVKLRVW
jgi:hypothetical protein